MARDTTSTRILDIRAHARGISREELAHTACPTCTRDAGAPYRRHDAHGRITEGCVDAQHTGSLVGLSESAAWHTRKKARAIRAAELEALTRK